MFGQGSFRTYRTFEYEGLWVAVEHRGLKCYERRSYVFVSQRAIYACSAPLSPVATGMNTTTFQLLLLPYTLHFQHQTSHRTGPWCCSPLPPKIVHHQLMFEPTEADLPYQKPLHRAKRFRKYCQTTECLVSGIAFYLNSINSRSKK